MSLNIKNKRSAVQGSAPTPAQLEDGEIGVNYNAADPALYVKDSAGAVIRLAGEGAVGAGQWDQVGDDLYPKVATSDVKIGGTLPGTPNIELKAADGSARFAGAVEAYKSIRSVGNEGDNPSNGDAGVKLSKSGAVNITNSPSAVALYIGETNGTGALTTHNLLALASGDLSIGGTLPGTPNIELKADGSASFSASLFTIGSGGKITQNLPSGVTGIIFNLQRDGTPVFQVLPSGTTKIGGGNIELTADGSAEFSGIVKTDGQPFQSATSNIIQDREGSSNRGVSGLYAQQAVNTTGIAVISRLTFAEDPVGARIALNRYIDSSTSVQDGDVLGEISASGGQGGNTPRNSSKIRMLVDGTSGAFVPGAIEFMTSGGGASPAARARITSAGDFLLGGTLPSAPNITLTNGGSGTFAGLFRVDKSGTGYVTIGGGSATYAQSFYNSSNNRLIGLRYDGGAEFAGEVQINGTSGSSNRLKITQTGTGSGDQSSIRLTTPASDYAIFSTGDTNALTIYDGNANANRLQLNSSGDVLIGGTLPSAPVITLAKSGNGSFSAKVISGQDPSTTAVAGCVLAPIGRLTVSRAGNTSEVFRGKEASIDTPTSRIYADGSASFAGSVSIGGTAAANTIDEYEEGTWTAIIQVGGSSANIAGRQCNYTRVGNLVTCSGFINTSGVATLSGDVTITGLPFTPKTGSICPGVITFENAAAGSTLTDNSWVVMATGGSTTLAIENQNSQPIQNTNFSGSASQKFRVSITYTI